MKRTGLICLATIVGPCIAAALFSAALSRIAYGAEEKATNLAVVAKASTSFCSGHENLNAINDGFDPANSGDKSHGAYGNWPQQGSQWVQYEWPKAISTNRVDVYWFSDGGGLQLPKACRLKYWDGSQFVPVENASGLGVVGNKFNTTTFKEVSTEKLRLEFDANRASTAISEWRVYDSGKSPNFAPSVSAGVDRVVVQPGKTFLSGEVKDDGKPSASPTVAWSKQSGPGEVTFEKASAPVTTATFSAPGEYVLKLSASDGQESGAATLKVLVEAAPPAQHLTPVYTTKYKVDGPLWNGRMKALIVNWIPHCIDQISDPKVREGGIQNFVEAGNKIAGRPHKPAVGAVFANAWVHQTIEAMCLSQMIDPQGDAEMIAAQKAIREKLDDFVPKILSAQEPDGYLQTQYTLRDQKRWTNKFDHEGYLAGYFMESALAHYLMTNKTDPRMYNAAKKLADCWVRNIGPAPKKAWYDGHQELEQALVRLARFVEDEEGAGKGRQYVELAKFLLECRKGGEEYDQSHLPVIQQYEAVGHSVRAVYMYSGMADVAMETGDVDFHSATRSIWDNIVNRKYYVTGGVGSGETSEGFGKDYSLPNHAYCESCSNCGELFFQHKMNLAWHDAKYADLYEETIYNAILGDTDLAGKNYTYTNSLDEGGRRYKWHVCPCCVGNIPKTLLMLPTWTYAKAADGLYVNLFAGSTINVGKVAGTEVEMVQKTDYPWKGNVTITVNPAQEKEFALRIRVPRRNISALYTVAPEANGVKSMTVNGSAVEAPIENGYMVIKRTWKAGDKVELELPLAVQRVKADAKIPADAGRVALRYGPVVFNIESVDQDINKVLSPDAPLSAEWKPELLGGVMVIKGKFADGSDLLAIPNYARMNRGEGKPARSIVWIKDGN